MECSLASAVLLAFAWVSGEMHPEVKVAKPHYTQSTQQVDKMTDENHRAVGAYVIDKKLIIVRDSWDCDRKWDQAILVHEMVHHFQETQGIDCRHNSIGCEAQAYALQDKFLKSDD
jgi:hypothetical protein